MFLKDIRDNILTMSFTTLSSSMKTSLSEFSFLSWTLRGSFFFYYYYFCFRFIAVEKAYLFTALIELNSFKGCDWLPFVWVPNRYRKQRVENNIISHFWFCLPSPLKSPWPSDASPFHKNFLAIHGSMLWWFMNILDMLSCLCFSIWTK